MGSGQFLQRLCRIRLAAGGGHPVTARGGLAGHFQPNATIGTGNQQALGHGSGHFLSGLSGALSQAAVMLCGWRDDGGIKGWP